MSEIKFSDFYGYDQDCSTLTSFTSAVAEVSIGCSQTLNQTYYHDGSGARPVANDTVYTNSGGCLLYTSDAADD